MQTPRCRASDLVPAGSQPAAGSSRRAFLRRALYLGGTAALVSVGAPGVRPAAAKKRGGTLTVGLPGDIHSLDPYQYFFGNFPILETVYDTLIHYDEGMKPKPRLARAWAIAPDGKSVRITLRSGVKFHSGKELVADDVVKNFEKAADKDRGFSLQPLVGNVEKAAALDAGTAVVMFKSVTADITDILQVLPIVDPTGMNSLKSRGAGTGPLRFVEWVPGDHVTLERHAQYWGAPLPYVDRVVIKAFRDTDAMVAALQSGIVDLAIAVPQKDVGRLSREFTVVLGAPGTTYDIRINPKRAPFDKKEARQALWYALDRQRIADKILFGLSKPTVLPWAPGAPAYDASVLARYPFDLNKAKELFAKAGVKGAKAEMMVSSQFPDRVAFSQILQADLAKIDFDLETKVVDQTEYYRRVVAGDFGLTMSAAGSAVRYPTQLPVGGSIYRLAKNPVWGDDVPKAYVEAMKEAGATLDPAKQKEAFRRIREALLDEAWAHPIAYAQYAYVMGKHVDGFATSVEGIPFLEHVSLEK